MPNSDVPFYVVHSLETERARCTAKGALALLEAEVVLLEDVERGYRECIKAQGKLAAIVKTNEGSFQRVLMVRVDSSTDDVERMVAAVQVLTSKNPTGRPPWMLPE